MRSAWAVTALGIVSWGLFTAITATLTHHLSHAAFGWYGSAIAACSLTVTGATLGLEKFAIKAIPHFRHHHRLDRWKGFLLFGCGVALIVGLLLGGISYGLWLLLDHPTTDAATLFRRLMYFMPAMALFMFLYEICSANDINVRTAVVYRVVVPACILGTIWLMLRHGTARFTMIDAGLAYGLAWVVGAAALLVWAARSTPPAVLHASPMHMRPIHWMLGGFGFVGFSLSMMMIGAAPVLVLNMVASDKDAGTMAVITQITSLMIVSLTGVTRIYAPRLADALASDDHARAGRIRAHMALSLTPVLAAFLLACVVLPGTILGAFGPHYANASAPLLITAVAVVPQAYSYLAPWELQFRNQQRFVLLSAAGGSVAGLAAMTLLAWRYGLLGATIGQCIMVVLIFGPMVLRARHLHHRDLDATARP